MHIALIADESKDNIKFIFEYSIKLYKEETINMFAKDYINILFKVVQAPNIRINDIEIEFDSYINYKEKYDTENIDFNF